MLNEMMEVASSRGATTCLWSGKVSQQRAVWSLRMREVSEVRGGQEEPARGSSVLRSTGVEKHVLSSGWVRGSRLR